MDVRATTLALAVAVVVGAGCASAATTKPKEPPPTVPGVRSAPPPAWIETRGGDRWLAFTDYCWTFTCVDSRPLEQRRDIPRIAVPRGEIVRFHLGFRPTKLAVEQGRQTYPLKAQREATWRVRGASGLVVLQARKAGLRAAYVARLRIR